MKLSHTIRLTFDDPNVVSDAGVVPALRLGESAGLSGGADPLRQRAGYADGLRSIAIGLAASRSIATGQAVNVSELGFPLG